MGPHVSFIGVLKHQINSDQKAQLSKDILCVARKELKSKIRMSVIKNDDSPHLCNFSFNGPFNSVITSDFFIVCDSASLQTVLPFRSLRS